MQLMIYAVLITVFTFSRGEDTHKCSTIKEKNKVNDVFKRVDQDTAETNFFPPLQENYLYRPNQNVPQQEGQFFQYEEGVAQGLIEGPQFINKPEYDFGYSVNDPITGDQKSHREVKSDNVVHGTYSLIEPDGSRRTVVYTADDINGFNAVVYKDPPLPVQGGFYYDQDHAATSDTLRDNLNSISKETEFGKKISIEKPQLNIEPVFNSKLLNTPIVVPNIPTNIAVSSEETSTSLVDKPVFSKNFMDELTKFDQNLNSIEPTVITKGLSDLPDTADVSPTSVPLLSIITPTITASSPKPFEENLLKNSEDEAENLNSLTTSAPPLSGIYPKIFRSTFINGEYPLLAHISPSYLRRYARYFH